MDRILVPKAGIEPARLAAVDFESTASTDFATSALKGMRKTLWIIPLPSQHATTIRTDVMQVLKNPPAGSFLSINRSSGLPPGIDKMLSGQP